jgi:hypothetical protein|tara:strand:- start:793 stop:1197 length:405 start_codon:yes stop_codon:yes gene_type:complete
MRNYKKERENYHSRPEQMIRNAARKRARRQMEKAGIAKRFDGKDIHHKDNDPENNDLNNLSLVTQHYNRKEPRLREKKLKDLQAKLTTALAKEDMGSVTGPHIAGTGDDNTVHTKPKKKVKKRISLIKGIARRK